MIGDHKYDFNRNPELVGKRFMPSHHGVTVSHRPQAVDLRGKLPACFDQGLEGSCGPNSADGLMCFFNPDVSTDGGFSRQQIYYSVRQLEKDVDQDAGVMTKDLFAILSTVGAAPEKLWPYIDQNLLAEPPSDVLQEASKYKITSYGQLVSEEDFLDCLAAGFPFILGFEVYDSLEGDQLASTGVMQRPGLFEADLGGHDVLVVGYDINFFQNPYFLKSNANPNMCSNTALLIRNSWGVNWGINGHFWMPIDYASSAQTGGDAWTGRK